MLQTRFMIEQNSVNLIKELRGYRWRKDGDGKIMRPLKAVGDDHAIDALRYCYTEINRGYGSYLIK